MQKSVFIMMLLFLCGLCFSNFSTGGSPYPGVELNEKFIGLLKDGYRMAQPEQASDDM